jgi:hypothetical protein
MDNPNFDWALGIKMKSLGGEDHRLKFISQIACLGDMADGITIRDHFPKDNRFP